MIGLLLALHPRAWRRRYGDEFRALLEASPLTLAVVLDVLLHAVRQHARAHPATGRILGAVAVTVLVEVGAVHEHLTDNILWPPTTVLRALALAMLLLPWLPVATLATDALRRHRLLRR